MLQLTSQEWTASRKPPSSAAKFTTPYEYIGLNWLTRAPMRSTESGSGLRVYEKGESPDTAIPSEAEHQIPRPVELGYKPLTAACSPKVIVTKTKGNMPSRQCQNPTLHRQGIKNLAQTEEPPGAHECKCVLAINGLTDL